MLICSLHAVDLVSLNILHFNLHLDLRIDVRVIHDLYSLRQLQLCQKRMQDIDNINTLPGRWGWGVLKCHKNHYGYPVQDH